MQQCLALALETSLWPVWARNWPGWGNGISVLVSEKNPLEARAIFFDNLFASPLPVIRPNPAARLRTEKRPFAMAATRAAP